MFSIFPGRRGQGHWTQIVSAILVVVVIIVLVILFATNIGQSQKTITQCTGVIGIDELKGSCVPIANCAGKQIIATASCGEGKVCCLG